VLSFRDPVHGFIRADPFEAALIRTRALQRLRAVHQLGFTYLVFPGAEHSRFSHALGAMALAGRVYDALAAKSVGLLEPGAQSRERRLVRVAALLHDVGHAPFSHSAEELFETGIDHEEMTRRLVRHEELASVFEQWGEGITPDDVCRLLGGGGDGIDQLLSQIISGELDVDKMDYLLRDSLFCGVRYGHFDLERLLDTMLAIEDSQLGRWGIGVDEGGVHALEALVMARYYMFTQVYFNVTGKVLELHLNQWLQQSKLRWRSAPAAFLEQDDVEILARMRRSSSIHARAIVERQHYRLAFETKEHLGPEEKSRFESLLPEMGSRFGADQLLVSNSAKDPHRLGDSRVLVLGRHGEPQPMEEASHFIRHLTRIDRYRIYAAPQIRDQVASFLHQRWQQVVE
jgi:HD superfamily phosphohydrolase